MKRRKDLFFRSVGMKFKSDNNIINSRASQKNRLKAFPVLIYVFSVCICVFGQIRKTDKSADEEMGNQIKNF